MGFSILYVFFHIYLFLILVYAIEIFILNINIQLIVINVKKQNFIIFEFLLNSHIFQHQEIHYLVYFIYKVLSFVSEYTNFFSSRRNTFLSSFVYFIILFRPQFSRYEFLIHPLLLFYFEIHSDGD